MSLTRSVLANRHAVWALVSAIVAFGVMGYLKLPMQLFPDTAPPLVNVITVYPGAAADDVAQNVSRILEDEFSALEGAVRINSSSQDNLSLVSVEFEYGRAVELGAVDVQNAVSGVRDRLPSTIREPQILKFSTNDRPVLTLGLTGVDLVAARAFAEDVLAPEIQRVNGVAAVDVFGGHARAVLVEMESRELEAHRISFSRVVDTIHAHNAALPAGTLRTERSQTMFRVEGRARNLDALAAIPLPVEDGSRMRLGDLAHIHYGALDDDAAFSINGKKAIALQVFKTTEANTVEVVEQAQAAAARMVSGDSPFSILVGEETASFTRTSISNLLGNIWQALGLAALLIFLFLARWSSAVVAAMAMVLSYGATFALMYATGTELNMVTLTAVILAVGMVVDAAVVVIENAERWRVQKGLSPMEAVIRGTDEIRMPIIAGAGTTLAVLVPLQFLPGFIGQTFGPLARTLMFAFSSSLLIALFVVPVLTLIATGDGSGRGDGWAERIARPFNGLMDGLRRLYVSALKAGLQRRIPVLLLALLLFVAGIVGLRLRGAEVLPRMDSGSFYVSLETPSGTSLEETVRVVEQVESLLRDEPEVVNIQAQAGFEVGMRSIGSSGVQGPTQGLISVMLTPRTERTESIWDIEARVRKQVRRIPGIRTVSVKQMGNTAKATTKAPLVVRISGADPLIINQLGTEVLERLSTVPSIIEPTRNWNLDLERTRVMVDELRAGQLGLSPAMVAAQMHAGSNGVSAGEYFGKDQEPQPIRVRYRRSERPVPEDLLRFHVFVPGSPDSVPLRAIAGLQRTVGQGLITREDASPNLEILAYTGPKPLNFTVSDAAAALEEVTVPKDYRLDLIGENQDMDEAAQALGTALGTAILIVYLLLVAQLRSFLHPLTILMTVPLSLAGVSAAVWIGGVYLSMPVMVGLILLVGIVVNNAIILLDFVEQRRAAGAVRREALIEAVHSRFRPIMMTSLSTIVGMIPLAGEWALGSERFAPLATAVIGGMTTATILTLVVIPILYDVFDDLRGVEPRPATPEVTS